MLILPSEQRQIPLRAPVMNCEKTTTLTIALHQASGGLLFFLLRLLCGSAPLRAKMKFIPLRALRLGVMLILPSERRQVPLRARDELRKDQPLLRSHITKRAAAFYFFF